jgi:hypothetical protein
MDFKNYDEDDGDCPDDCVEGWEHRVLQERLKEAMEIVDEAYEATQAHTALGQFVRRLSRILDEGER